MAKKKGSFVQRVLGHWSEPEETPAVQSKSEIASWGKDSISLLWEGIPLECRVADGELQLSARSVCAAAGIANVSDAVSRLDADEKIHGIGGTDSIGRSLRMWWLTIPGFFSIVSGSVKPEAKKLKRFVHHNLLPSVMKHGCWPPPETAKDGTPIRKWIKSTARRCGFPLSWMRQRQDLADGNKAADRETFAMGGNGSHCSARYNALYKSVFGYFAKQLKKLLDVKGNESPLKKIAEVPAAWYGAANVSLTRNMRDGLVTPDTLVTKAEEAGKIARQAFSQIQPGYEFKVIEDQKGNKILDAVRQLPRNAAS